MNHGFSHSVTPRGFWWGPMRITRIASDERFGVIVRVSGARQYVDIRVSPGGRKLEIDGPHEIGATDQ